MLSGHSGVNRPVVKDKSVDIENSINYRDVIISYTFFKLVKYLILPYIRKLSMNPYKFAYRNNSSSILVTCILREIFKSNLEGDSCIYSWVFAWLNKQSFWKGRSLKIVYSFRGKAVNIKFFL